MRYLVILRGLPASGKSTFVLENDLTNYTLSSDKYRLINSSPTLDIYGNLIIDQSFNGYIWASLYADLEERMKKGLFTVIDATHARRSDFDFYNILCKKYFYKLIIVEFDAPFELCISRDKERPFSVGQKVIERIAGNWEPLPKPFNVVFPEQLLNALEYSVLDFTNKKVYIIGAIHGQYLKIKQFIDKYVDLDNDKLIFVGDYFYLDDIDNRNIVEFLSGITDNPNVFVCLDKDLSKLMRSHWESHKQYTNMFVLPKNIVTPLLHKVVPCVSFTYNNNSYMVSSGNLSLPVIDVFMPESLYINGVGKFKEDIIIACDIFHEKTAMTQIFSKNYISNKIKINSNCYNVGRLCSYETIQVMLLDKEQIKKFYA